MKHLPIGPLYYEFSRHHEPRLRIEPGETIVVGMEDALSGQIRTDADRRDKVEDAVQQSADRADLGRGGRAGRFAGGDDRRDPPHDRPVRDADRRPEAALRVARDRLPARHARLPIRDGQIYWSDAITIPYAPMLGCIGTAPDWGCPTTCPAGPHGGNMDIVEICPGNTVYLPVFVPGGFLYLGDAHAAMGHGELSATGLEMPAEVTITVNLVKGKRLAWPRIESADEIMTVVSGCPMERSIAQAYAQLILWMEADYGWDRWRAYDILTHVGQISVGYYGLGTVAAKIERRYLGGAGK